MSRFEIDDTLRKRLEAGVALVVATRDAQLAPEAVRATALRVEDRTHVLLVIPRAWGARALRNLESNGEIAVVASDPRTYQTVQLKGRCTALEPLDEAARESSRRWLEAFTEGTRPLGLRAAQIRNLWVEEGRLVRMEVTAGFDQTPGPGAGRALEASGSGTADRD